MNNALDWMSVYPEPILMLLKGFCFPEFATCLSAWVESSYFGVVIVHTPEELAHGNVEMTSHQREEVKSKSVTLPTLGSQIPIPKVTRRKDRFKAFRRFRTLMGKFGMDHICLGFIQPFQTRFT